MATINSTKENVNFEEYVTEVQQYFFYREWVKILSPYQTFYTLYLSGVSVAVAVQAGHIVLNIELQDETIIAIANHHRLKHSNML
jgi:hypothetical protein